MKNLAAGLIWDVAHDVVCAMASNPSSAAMHPKSIVNAALDIAEELQVQMMARYPNSIDLGDDDDTPPQTH